MEENELNKNEYLLHNVFRRRFEEKSITQQIFPVKPIKVK